ncbi:hypothetical protein HDU79_002047 [Rhizoclosmatium sp. JEL0117]|nr:hypothetical protein HDU79_002047 [Rhizoclosmatium sp. JEL0117]
MADTQLTDLHRRYVYYYAPNYGLYIGLSIGFILLLIMIIVLVQRSRRNQPDEVYVYDEPVVYTTTTTTYAQPAYGQQQVVYAQPGQQVVYGAQPQYGQAIPMQQNVYGQPVQQQQQVYPQQPVAANDGRLGTYGAPAYSPAQPGK